MTRDVPLIEVYTQPGCAACETAARYFDRIGAHYVSRDVTVDAAALEALVSRGFMQTPVIRIGDEWLGGFRRRVVEAAMRRHEGRE